MRTTLTLDPDIARQLQDRARKEGRTFKEVVNENLRKGLAQNDSILPPKKRFKVVPHRGGFRPGVDLQKLNQLNDEIEAEESAGKARTTRGSS